RSGCRRLPRLVRAARPPCRRPARRRRPPGRRERRPRHRARPLRQRLRADGVPGGAVHAGARHPPVPPLWALRRARLDGDVAALDLGRLAADVRVRRARAHGGGHARHALRGGRRRRLRLHPPRPRARCGDAPKKNRLKSCAHAGCARVLRTRAQGEGTTPPESAVSGCAIRTVLLSRRVRGSKRLKCAQTKGRRLRPSAAGLSRRPGRARAGLRRARAHKTDLSSRASPAKTARSADETALSSARSSVTQRAKRSFASYRFLTSAVSFVIDAFASPNSITVFGL